MNLSHILIMPTLLTFAGADGASDHVRLRAVLGQLGATTEPRELARAPIPGFLEVVRGTQVLYLSQDGSLLIDGDILAVDRELNLTEQTRASIRRDLLASVPPNERIIVPAKGTAKGHITVFVDTDCPYCGKLHEQRDQFAERGLEVHYLFYPRSGPAGASFNQAAAVWCSADRLAALEAALSGTPLSAPQCAHPVMAHYELARALELKGTPAVVLNGTIRYGVIDADEVLAAAHRSPRSR